MNRTTTEDFARLADDAYVSHPVNKEIELGGVKYRVLAHSDLPSGYQGTLYWRVGTNEMAVAHRGTEFDDQPIKDLIKTDGAMVLSGVNLQGKDALDFTHQAQLIANEFGRQQKFAPHITLTGHSLGGTHVQATSHATGLPGVTFNAYGAAELWRDIPTGGNQVINHVRATDLVSSASRHYGSVEVYALPEDILHLQRHGYENDNRFWTDIRSPTTAALPNGIRVHDIATFHSDPSTGRESIMTAENQALYQAYRPMIDKYRGDVGVLHDGFSLPRRAVEGVLDRVRDMWPGGGQQDEHQIRVEPRRSHAPSEQSAESTHMTPAPATSRLEQNGVALVDRLLASMERGDGGAYRQALHEAARSSPAQTMRAEAIAVVDRQEQWATQALAQAQQQDAMSVETRRTGPRLG